jgi:NodT family efflux transporter outer membrane factor (OMF) lipoprotein
VRRALRPVSWAIMLALSACTVGPNYKLPDDAKVNAPAARGGLIATAGITAEAPPDTWWKLYRSPVLDGLIQQALAANTDLRAAEANLERAQGLLDQTNALSEPSVAVNFDTNYNQRSAEAYVHPGDIPAAQLYDTGLSISYDLDLFGRLRRMSESADDEAEVARAARDLVRINVVADTARAYADLCNAGEQLTVSRRIVDVQDRYLALTHMAVAAGRREQIEIEQQEAAAEQARASLPTLEARQKNALFRIATLAGRTPAEFDADLPDCAESLDLDVPLPAGDGAGLLARRPDIRAAERRLAASTAQIGVATADLYPSVRLGATIGSTGMVSDFAIDRTNRYSGGPGISWQLNQSIPRATIAQAKAQAKADLAHFDGAVLTALRETDSALNVYAHDEVRLAKLTAARDRSARAAEDARILRAGGRIDALVALAAERTLANADEMVAAAEGQISADEMTLFLALGGGWDVIRPAPDSRAQRPIRD